MDAINTKPNLEKQRLVESALEIIAQNKGDITQAVINHYFEQFPDAKALFFEHRINNDETDLQQEMVAQALYCLMTFYERPIEVEIVLLQTVPHHDQLGITVKHFAGLLHSLFDVAFSGLSLEEDSPKIECLRELQEQLTLLINNTA